MDGQCALWESFATAMENAGDADDDGVINISMPIAPGSTSVHSFKAMKVQNFNMEATAANLDWLVKYANSDNDSPELQADRNPRASPCKLKEDTLAWMCHCWREFITTVILTSAAKHMGSLLLTPAHCGGIRLSVSQAVGHKRI